MTTVDIKSVKMSKFKIANPKVGEPTEFSLASPATIDTYKPEIITQGKDKYETTGVMSGNAMLVVKIN
ncbi:MAG: hypothetical protein ACRDBG_19450 [Waterburya sp.]